MPSELKLQLFYRPVFESLGRIDKASQSHCLWSASSDLILEER